MIFREEDFSEEEFRSVALLVERRAGDCGRNDDGTFAIKNDCQEDGGGISGIISPFAKSRTPAAKKDKKGGGGGGGEIKLGNVRRQDVMLRGGKSVAVIDSEAKDRAKADRQRNPMPSGSHPASTADLYDRTLVQRDDPKKPAKITSHDPVFTESDLAQNGTFIAHESVARLLTSRHEDERRAAGGEGPAAVIDTRRDLSSDQFEYVVSAIKQDVDRAYEEGRNPGFYSTDIAECMEVMSGFYPELSNADEAKRRGTTPEDAAFVFTMITAITSNGTDPALNLESADRIYRLYREHGSVRTPDEIMGGERAKEIKSALNRFQDMIDEFGESRVRAVLSGVTHASTVTRTMKKLAKSSQEFGGSWGDKGIGSGELADEVVPVAAIFGPKIGSFFANLSGKHQFLTMDRWLMRSVGRVTGELITRSTPEAANKQANAALKAIKSKPRSRDILFGVDKPPLSLTRDDVIKSLELQARTGIVEENGAAYEWAKAAQRAFNKVPRGTRPDGSSYGSYGVDSDPQIHEAHKAGNTLAKSLVHEQQDPRSARARRVIREVFREVAKRVSAEDPAARGKVQVSEVQAILWQYEQNLWKRLGAKTKIEGDSLYSAAAKALKQRRDSGEEIATLRPEKQRRPKSVRSADAAASEASEEFDYQNQAGQDLWDNEFENAGVDFVEFVKELLEGESRSARSFFKSLTDQVHSARCEGESSVTLRAGEARTLLPRIGFDALIPSELRGSLPESLSHARTLIDLHVTKEGANWWRDNGTDVDVVLDLDDRTSPQNRAFDAFVRKFFHESRDLPVGSGDGWASSADLIKFDELWDELDSEGVWDEYDSEQIDFRSADCGANKKGGGGFQEGNTCGGGDRPLASKGEISKRFESGEKPSKALQSLGFRRMNFTAIDKALENADDKQKQRILADLDSLAKAIAVDKRLADVPIRVGPVSEIFKNNKEVLRSLRDGAKEGSLGAVADAESGTLAIFTDGEEYDEGEYKKGWNSSNKREAMVLHELAHLEHYKSAAQVFPHPGEDELPGVHPIDYYMTKAESRATSLLKKEPSLKKKVRGVSEYASTDIFEFVAEYSSAVSLGEIQPDKDLDRLCVAAGAKPPRRSKR